MDRSSIDKTFRHLGRVFALAGTLAGMVAPAISAPARPEDLAKDAPQSANSPVVALVGAVEIHQTDLDSYIGREVYDLAAKIYTLRKQALASMIDRMLVRQEADKRHMDESEIIKDALKSVPNPSAVQVARQWADNYDALRPLGETTARYRMALDLLNNARTAALREYLHQLEMQSHVQILLEQPSYKLHARSPACRLGDAAASASASQLTVFLDYECPVCKKIEPILTSLVEGESGAPRVGIAVKQFPLPQHRGAFEAAVAAVCAARQQRFSAMHDLLFTKPDHSPEALALSAQQAGLSLPAFRACTASEAAQQEVLLDMEEAHKNGVEGTPSIFLNGEPFALGTEDADQIRTSILEKLTQRGRTQRLEDALANSDQARK